MGKESSKKHATSKKQVQAKGKGKEKNKEKASTASSGVSECESENEYLLQLLDLKATCADWNNLFSRSLDEDRRMMQCKCVFVCMYTGASVNDTLSE